MIRLTKEFTFESAHALEGYDGACREIHGHSYRLFVTVKGEPIDDVTNPKCGMVIDFGDLKRIVNEQIISRLDHSFVMRQTPRATELATVMSSQFNNVILVDYQPTCENMLADFAARIGGQLPAGVTLHALKLHETATSYAEWYADENR
ncbi:MAG: 6-carboxytetrahydropterin synthase [Rikenellaceae bacterium]